MHKVLGCTGLALAAAGGYAYAANWPASQIFGRTIVAGGDAGEIALTYDDGPNEQYTPRLLDLLAAHQVRATFFLIGRHAMRRSQIVRAIHAAGHLIGNHTMNHPVLLWQGPRRIRQELSDCNKAIEDALGEPVRFFRPPHGARRPDVLQAARELGLAPVMWNVTGCDWKIHDPAQLIRRIERLRTRRTRCGTGANILLHDGSQCEVPGLDRTATLAATGSLLDLWKRRGLRTVTVDRWKLNTPGELRAPGAPIAR